MIGVTAASFRVACGIAPIQDERVLVRARASHLAAGAIALCGIEPGGGHRLHQQNGSRIAAQTGQLVQRVLADDVTDAGVERLQLDGAARYYLYRL